MEPYSADDIKRRKRRTYVIKEEDMTVSGFPNQNLIVGWVLRTVAIPNINPHLIMKTVQEMTKQVRENIDK